jgi:hypothetical protein
MAHMPYPSVLKGFLSLESYYSHLRILFSHLIKKKFSPSEKQGRPLSHRLSVFIGYDEERSALRGAASASPDGSPVMK